MRAVRNRGGLFSDPSRCRYFRWLPEEDRMLYRRTGDEWTEYRPPKSTSFGHAARRRDPVAAWRATVTFLRAHCLFELFPPEVTLRVWDPGRLAGREASKDALERMTARFGPSEAIVGGREWRLDPSSQDAAVTSCARVNLDWPKRENGPAAVTFAFRLGWRRLLDAPDTARDRLRLQDGGSTLGVAIWKRPLFLQPRFVFPLAWDSPDLARFLEEIEADCPFRFRDQYFRRLLPSRSGFMDQVRKLPGGWRDA